MKVFAAIAILIALYLLSRIAYPKPQIKKKTDDIVPKRETDENSVIGKSSVVLSSRSQREPTPATALKSGVWEENPDSFATENELVNIHVPLQYDGKDTGTGIDEDEEAEELLQIPGGEAATAGGFTFEEMDMAFGQVNHPSGNEVKAAEVLYRLENTGCVTQLAEVSEEKAERIKYLIDLHVKSLGAGGKNEDVNDLDVTEFLS